MLGLRLRAQPHTIVNTGQECGVDCPRVSVRSQSSVRPLVHEPPKKTSIKKTLDS